MTKKQTSQDNIFYFQEIAQDILNLSLRFSYQEIGFYLTFKAAYIFHKGKIPFNRICQFCRIFSNQESFVNFIQEQFEIVDGFIIAKTFDREIQFIVEKSNERRNAVKSRWENTIVDTNENTNVDTNGDTKQETSNKKHQTRNKKLKTPNFIPPTLQEIQSYCQERKNSVFPDKFLNYYQAKGWMIGKNKMKDWKAAVRTWEGNDKQPQQSEISTINSIAGGEYVTKILEFEGVTKIYCKTPTAKSIICSLPVEQKDKIRALFGNKKFEFIC